MIWNILEPDPDLVRKLQQDFAASEIIARVLANRGFTSREAARPFFNPSLDQLHDPFLMRDMDTAVERIIHNIQIRKPILVFGDYDVDGTTGASLLYLTLRSLGAEVNVYIPVREQEGYGLSTGGIDRARSSGADLLITCDCGINAFEEVDYANRQGVDVIITDHHIPDETLPAARAILNPKRAGCEYPFKGLCGCGVAFKLAAALDQRLGVDPEERRELLPLVTLGTSADMVPIQDENRVMIYHGLSQLQTTTWPGLEQLLVKAGLKGKLPTVGQLVFGLAPRINAAGRLGDAHRAVELFTTRDRERARTLATELDQENRRRQEIQEAVVEEAREMVAEQVNLDEERAIVVAGYGWHPGVVGIVASRLKEDFSRPTVVISLDEEGEGKGSARSIRGLDLYEALTATSGHLEGYGGHPMAAGLTIREENLGAFRQDFVSHANRRLSADDLIPRLTVDGILSFTDITSRLMNFLEKLGPYGPGNMRPKFVARGVKVAGVPRLVGNGNHLRFRTRQGRSSYPAIGFNLAEHYPKLTCGQALDLAFLLEINEWQGQKNIQLNVRDIKVSQDTKISQDIKKSQGLKVSMDAKIS